MAKILKFDPERRGKRVNTAAKIPCQIILFMGVRYEHLELNKKGKKTLGASSSSKARRRKA